MNSYQTESNLIIVFLIFIYPFSVNAQIDIMSIKPRYAPSLQDQFLNKEKKEAESKITKMKKLDDLLVSSIEELDQIFSIIVDNATLGLNIVQGTEKSNYIFSNPYLFQIDLANEELTTKIRKLKLGRVGEGYLASLPEDAYNVPKIEIIGKVSSDGSIEYVDSEKKTAQFGSWDQTVGGFSNRKDFFYKKWNGIKKGYYHSTSKEGLLLDIFQALSRLKKEDGIKFRKSYDLAKGFLKKHRTVCNEGLKVQQAHNQLYQSSSKIREDFFYSTCF